MRAATRPHTAAAVVLETAATTPRESHARGILMRLLVAIISTLALLLVWRPTVVHAQESAASPAPVTASVEAAQDSTRRTHVVKAGETLWSLAVRYYGDGHQWPELARRNGISPTSRKPLLVGVRLTVPSQVPARTASGARARPGADVPAVATTPATPPRTADAPPSGGRSLAAQTAGRGNASGGASADRPGQRAAARSAPKSPDMTSAAADSARANQDRLRPLVKSETPIDRGAVRVGLVDPNSAATARGREDATIFLRRLPSVEETQAMIQAARPIAEARPRTSEYNAAPFTLQHAELDRGGAIVRRVGSTSTPTAPGSDRMLLEDEVEITLPAGTQPRVGDELISVSDAGPLRRDRESTRVITPTGVIRIVRADAGQPVIGSVRAQSGSVASGQRLLVPSGGAAAPVAPTPSDRGDIAGTVLWVENSALLPTLQSFVIISTGTAQGAKAGDHFALVRPRGSPNSTQEERVAIVRIVRTGTSESTGIVVKQDQGAIATGVAVRRIARAP